MIIHPKKLASFVEMHSRGPAIIDGRFGGPSGSAVQTTEWSCGAAAIVNVCDELGFYVDEEEVMEVAATNLDGTTDDGMINALNTIGLKTEVLHTDDPEAAWNWLLQLVANGFPCILCVDSWDHWITVTGTDGDNMFVRDSEMSRSNIEKNGVHLIQRTVLMPRWEYAEDENAFYAIAVSRPEAA